MLVTPDCFSGTLTAREAAHAIADGWLRQHPDDDVTVLPLSDGGPGFIDTAAEAFDATLVSAVVSDARGRPIVTHFARWADVAWIESAQACGLDKLGTYERDPLDTTSLGVGELINAAIDDGATKIVIGLGGTATNDAGAGALRALGATSQSAALDVGGYELRHIKDIDFSEAQSRVEGIDIVIASDVDNPLLGLRGATAMFSRQKGADDFAVMQLEGALEKFAAACGRRSDGKDPAVALGAGAGGGLGYGLMMLGAKRVAGIDTVIDAVNLDAAIAEHDLVITGEGCLDDQSLHGKVVVGVATHSASAGKPCIAIAGEVRLGKRECASVGLDSAYSMSELVSRERSLSDAAEVLSEVTQRVARTWGRR